MSSVVDIVRKIVQHEMGRVRVGELGVVTSIFAHASEDDHNNYECNIRLKNSRANGNPLELRKVPIATGWIGSAVLPNVGDLVLVSFVQGNVNQPIVTSRLYNDEDRPPLHNPNEVIHRFPLAAEENEIIKLELRNIADNDPPREAVVEMPPKVKLLVNDHEISTRVDKTAVTIVQKDDDDGAITIESGGSKITIGQDGDIQIEAMGAVTLSASGDMNLSAPNISIESDEKIEIKAGTDGIFSTGAKASIESSAPMEIKSGATAKIEASATMDIKGATININ